MGVLAVFSGSSFSQISIFSRFFSSGHFPNGFAFAASFFVYASLPNLGPIFLPALSPFSLSHKLPQLFAISFHALLVSSRRGQPRQIHIDTKTLANNDAMCGVKLSFVSLQRKRFRRDAFCSIAFRYSLRSSISTRIPPGPSANRGYEQCLGRQRRLSKIGIAVCGTGRTDGGRIRKNVASFTRTENWW